MLPTARRRTSARRGPNSDIAGKPRSGAYRVVAAVDVDDLAGGLREPVGQQRDARLATAVESFTSHPSGARSSHTSSNCEKPGIDFAASVRIGPAATGSRGCAGRRGRVRGSATSTRARPWPRPSSRTPATRPCASKSSPTIEPPSVMSGTTHVGERLQASTRTPASRRRRRPTAPPGTCRPGTTAGANPIACSAPSTRPHRSASVVANGIDVLGHRHVELEHGRSARQLAGRALGERQTSTRAGEHDLGPLLLRELRDAERQRGVGEHAGDEDALAVEQSHGASDRRCGGDVTAEPGVQG